MKFFDMLLAESTKRIVNISQPQGRWKVKCSDSLALNEFHAYVGNDWRDARAHRSAKRLLVNIIIIRENSRIKTKFMAVFNVRNVKSSA